MRIAIVGIGDYGGRFAVRLTNAGADVTLIARGKTLERLRTEGLNSTASSATPAMRAEKVNATDDCAAVGHVDAVFMCVKLYQLDEAMETASPLVGPDTAVLGFQNGVTAEDRLIHRFGADRVLGVGASANTVPLAIGELPNGVSDRTRAIVSVLESAGVNVVEHENVSEAIWGKFILTSGGGITALARLSVGEVVKIPELVELGGMAAAEAATLASAKGIPFGSEQADRFKNIIAQMAVNNPAWRPSLLQDLDAGRQLELEAWSGGTVRIGKELGIDTPANFAIYAGLKPYENGAL
ncbi:MAG: ketopantoate reductase family protein [Dehalococcoidia bacterium]